MYTGVSSFAGIAAPLNEKLEEGKVRTFDTFTGEEHKKLATLQGKIVSYQK